MRNKIVVASEYAVIGRDPQGFSLLDIIDLHLAAGFPHTHSSAVEANANGLLALIERTIVKAGNGNVLKALHVGCDAWNHLLYEKARN